MVTPPMTDTNTQANDKAVEAMAKAIHDHWQGAPSKAARSWEETCEKLPGQAEDFRRKARAALSAALPEIRREAKAAAGWKFALGAQVAKHSGSWWEGTVVGTYSTEQTPRGYCVQLNKPNGPVQIYPEAALAALPEPPADKERGK